MWQEQYDITVEDLNPTFLFSTQSTRKTTEQAHSHDFMEIAVILDGEGEFSVNNSLISVKKGDILLFNPGVVHQSRKISELHPTTEFYTGFTNFQFCNMQHNELLFPETFFLIHPKEKIFLQISRLAESIMAESCSTKPGRYFMLKSYLTQLIVILYREQTEHPKETMGGRFFESNNKKYIVEQMIDYFDKHFTEKISLDQIARNMYLSPFYLSRLFKSELGDTPINYLIRLRMKEASHLLLEHPDFSIQEIAQLVGYEDAYHFSKVFKKHFGVSPSGFRRNQLVSSH